MFKVQNMKRHDMSELVANVSSGGSFGKVGQEISPMRPIALRKQTDGHSIAFRYRSTNMRHVRAATTVHFAGSAPCRRSTHALSATMWCPRAKSPYS